MSCAIVVIPAVVAAWPVLLPVLSAAVSACGYAICRHLEMDLDAATQTQTRRAKTTRTEVEVSLEQSEVLTEAMNRETALTATKGDIQVTISRDARGQLRVCAAGENVPKHVLHEEAQELTNRIVQQYAYHRLMTELKQRGFQVSGESVSEDQRIRLTVRRHS